MSETNTNQREPGSDRDPILEAENHQQAQRAPLSLKVRILRRLAWLGRLTRHQLWFFLIMMGACWG
ncbi:MAG: ABC transporter permease, partial [Acetobacter orientalis]